MDIHSLDRFIEAQERMYAVALEEIKSGLKRLPWMWYIFRSCVVWARVQWRTYTASQGLMRRERTFLIRFYQRGSLKSRKHC